MDDLLPDTANTDTQTQNSQVDWSQSATTMIPTIWGRLYSSKVSLSGGGGCWKTTDKNKQEYIDLIQPEFSLGRAMSCTFPMKTNIIKADIIRNVSKQHFVMKRDLLPQSLSPAIITDLSYNGTFVNGVKIGKNNSRVLDDNDMISVTHPAMTLFVFKDLLKNEQDQVPEEISQKYYISRTLGQGACGVVKLVYDKTKCTKYAMKIIKKSRLTNGQINHLNNPDKIMNEVKITKALKHPCIISVEEAFDSREAVYIILELMQGGELFDRISKQGHLSERLTRFLFRQMVLAVKYLHSQGITHRDLKPENVLLGSRDEETLVKITDFGLSKIVGEHTFMRTMCGTPLYLAPEVVKANGKQCYGPEIDVWSLGVILFVCLVGYLPFSAEYKDLSLENQILNGRYRYSQAHWRGVSHPAKLLMKRMLTVNVHRRITLKQILEHPWMQDTDVIMRVEKLMQSVEVKNFKQLTVSGSGSSDQENNNNDNNVKVQFVANAKRALSDSSNSCEPLPKKLRLTKHPDSADKYDTASADSMCSD